MLISVQSFFQPTADHVIKRVSTAATGAQADNHSGDVQISPDGRYMLFVSRANNLIFNDTNNKQDAFLKDLVTGAVTRVSSTATGAQANDDSYNARLSPDGRYVLFESMADNLVAGDTNGTYDVFLKDLGTGAITRVSTTTTGAQAEGSSGVPISSPRFSPDGRYVLFESQANNLVAGDTNGVKDIFLKDLVTGAVTRVSTNSTGEQAWNDSVDARFSPDGRYVLFQSGADNLVAGDTNGRDDVFLKDLSTGAVTRLSTTAAGVQAMGSASYIGQFSSDGRYVFFNSGANNLVAGDTNNADDVFRVDLLYKANAGSIAEGRFLETTLGVGAASSATIAWGDGTSSTVTPAAGQASFNHTYASTGTKAATVTLVEGALTWHVAHTIDLGASTMVRNTAVADTLSGGAGRDSLTGDAFANILRGGAGNDRLSAAAGNDSLEGGSGNDVLSASTGNDRLSGGAGKDTLTGSTGRDVFVFDDRETGSSKSRADYLTDFSGRRGDKIDLKAIDANTKKRGDQKFLFIGDETSFSKAGEVRFEKTKSYTYVYLNTDNDKAAEAVLKIKGTIEMQKSWFVL